MGTLDLVCRSMVGLYSYSLSPLSENLNVQARFLSNAIIILQLHISLGQVDAVLNRHQSTPHHGSLDKRHQVWPGPGPFLRISVGPMRYFPVGRRRHTNTPNNSVA